MSLRGSEIYLLFLIGCLSVGDFVGRYVTVNAGSNKASSSSTSLNTRKLDEETENLTREFLCFVCFVGSLSLKVACFYSGSYAIIFISILDLVCSCNPGFLLQSVVGEGLGWTQFGL